MSTLNASQPPEVSSKLSKDTHVRFIFLKTIFAIFKKEMRVYLTTPIGFTGVGVYAFVLGLIFINALNHYQQYTLTALQQQRPEILDSLNFNDQILVPVYSTVLWIFLFFIPFLTMRLIAEEKQLKTFELLMTLPLRSSQIVFGKFMAVNTMILGLVLLPIIFPIILSIYGTGPGGDLPIEWMPVGCATLILFLVGVFFASVGMWISSTTESQVVSALLTFSALLLAFVLPTLSGRLDGILREFIQNISPLSHVQYGLQGRLSARDLTYFLSLIPAALFLTIRTLESERWRT